MSFGLFFFVQTGCLSSCSAGYPPLDDSSTVLTCKRIPSAFERDSGILKAYDELDEASASDQAQLMLLVKKFYVNFLSHFLLPTPNSVAYRAVLLCPFV